MVTIHYFGISIFVQALQILFNGYGGQITFNTLWSGYWCRVEGATVLRMFGALLNSIVVW